MNLKFKHNRKVTIRLLQYIFLLSYIINLSYSKNLYKTNIKKKNDLNLDDDIIIEIEDDEIYNSNTVINGTTDQIIEFNLDENFGSNIIVNMDQNLNDNNEKEDEVIEIDFSNNDINSIKTNPSNEVEDKKEKDITIVNVNPDPNQFKNTKISFTPPFTPIKYLPDEEKEKLKKNKNDNAYISSNNDISNFSGFYDQLTSDEKSIYDKIVESSRKSPPELTVSVTISSSLSYNAFHSQIVESAERVISAVISDYTELWWIGTYRLGMSSRSPYLVQFKFQIDTGDSITQVVNINKKFEIMKEDIIKRISDLNLTSNYAKLKFIHDYLITKIVYTFGRDHIRTLYGALVENKCVCEGYAEAFQYLARYYGIDCIIARSEGHEWNFVKMDSNWYVVDVTWDDPQISNSMEPSGSYANLYTSYFLIGTSSIVSSYSNTRYENEEDHKLVYSAFGDGLVLKYPVLASTAYTPSSSEKTEANKINMANLYTLPGIALANCGNSRGSVKCPASNYFCINGDNELYKSTGSQCKKVYYENLEKTIVFLKDNRGYTEYNDEVTTDDTSEFIIYECLKSDGIDSGCTIYTEEYYHDTENQHIYHLESNYQYKQLRGVSYNTNGDTYICDIEGVCTIDIFPGYYLAGTITSGKYNKLIHCSTTTSGRKTTTTCSDEAKPTVNGYYINGSSSGKSLIECSNTSSSSPSCYVSVPPSSIKTTGYGYLDAGNDNSSSSSYAGIIVCTSTVCSSKNKPSDDTSFYVIDASVSVDTAIITCNKTNCRSGSGSLTNGYAYIDGTTDGNVLLSNGRKFTSTSSKASSSSSKYYIDASSPNQIITCSYNSTSKKIICTSGESHATASTMTYFIDSGISGNIIECTTSTCTSKTPKAGYYITGNSEYPLIQCSNSSTQINCNTVSKNNIKQAYYLEGSSTSDSKKYSKVIYCSSATSCSVITTTVKGYYIEGSSTSNAQLIYSDGSNYSLISTINVGYYLDGSSSTNGSDYTQVIYCSSSSVCSTIKTKYIGYYIDGSSATSSSKKRATTTSTYSKLIVCDGTKYTSVTTTNHVGYYLDGSSTTNNTKYKKVIYCSSATSCTQITTTIKGYYIDGTSTTNNTDYSKLILSDGSYYSSLASTNPGYYLNGNSSTNNVNYSKLIYCVSTTSCSIVENSSINEGFYFEGGTAASATSYTQLISCTENSNSKTCIMHNSSSSFVPFNGYYVSGMNDKIQFPLIKCVSRSCEKIENTSINSGYYMEGSTSTSNGSNYAKVITCTVNNGKASNCVVKSLSNGYYVNAESTTLTDAIIYCNNKNCVIQTPSTKPAYYVGVDEGLDGLIQCAEPSSESTSCVLSSAFSSQGYYLNAGSDSTTKPLILCNTTEGCQSLKVDLGYYVNAGDIASNPIIKCESVGRKCTAEKSVTCPTSSSSTAGDFCYDDNKLKFFNKDKSEAVYASSSDYYTYATIIGGKFPGIKNTITTIMKVTQYSITQFEKNGVVMIDDHGHLIDSLTPDQTANVYDCSDTVNGCVEVVKCTPNNYMFDSENKKAVFCNSNGILEYVQSNGYFINNDLVTANNYHPYLIKCTNNGESCSSIKTSSPSYYINSGYDSVRKGLIYCDGKNCMNVEATAGYYVAQEGNGLITCASSTSCNYSKPATSSKYINSGYDSLSRPLIQCTKDNGCSSIRAASGYFTGRQSSILIQCTSTTSCSEITPPPGFYENADESSNSNTIIHCEQINELITCAIENMETGFYISNTPNKLIRCKNGSSCSTYIPKNGFFRGAIKKQYNYKRSMIKRGFRTREAEESYNIIQCSNGKCKELTISELQAIPICEFDSTKNQCYITLEYSMRKQAVTSIPAGDICTNADRSIFYFATDSIVVKPNVISGVTSTYVYTTTSSNCLVASDEYIGNYYAIGSNIYQLETNSVINFNDLGYYFINIAKNTLATGKNIDEYNDPNIRIFKCNDDSCSVLDNPSTTTYYADINKKIIKYNVEDHQYSFAYDEDITCIFDNNICTPNADLNDKEFCITYKGELVLVQGDIKSRESGNCHKTNNVNSYIYGFGKKFYNMNQFSAEMINQDGYYIISVATNNTYVISNSKNKIKNANLILYGCHNYSCNIYEPKENIYYYDKEAMNILKYENGQWVTPNTSGYAYISIDPSETGVYHFTKTNDDYVVDSLSEDGYYHTIDDKMYYCDDEFNMGCTEITNSGYYFTKGGEIYYCIYDSEQLEDTECVRQICISGQYYYIDDNYYFCDTSSTLIPVRARHCLNDYHVVVNFPIELTKNYPYNVKRAMRRIEMNNNSTAVVARRGHNYLDSVSGIFTNCTYDVSDTKSNFDLLCLNNYVKVDQFSNDVYICSVDHLDYVQCIEDEQNPNKCNVSSSIHSMVRPSILLFTLITILLILLNR